MVTYKYVAEVVRSRCVNHQAKRVDLRAIVLLIATFVGALIVWIIKQKTQILLVKQTNQTNITVHMSSSFSIFLTIE